jgi:hypothetical protein
MNTHPNNLCSMWVFIVDTLNAYGAKLQNENRRIPPSTGQNSTVDEKANPKVHHDNFTPKSKNN